MPRRLWLTALGLYVAAMAAAMLLASGPPAALPASAPVAGSRAAPAAPPWAYLRLPPASGAARLLSRAVRAGGAAVTEALAGYAPTVAGLMGAAYPGLTAGAASSRGASDRPVRT